MGTSARPQNLIYFDNAATTPLAPEVLRAMHQEAATGFANPSSQHRVGRAARDKVEQARSVVAEYIGCQPEELIFTSGGTESINTAIVGASTRCASGSRRAIVTSMVEHGATLTTCHVLENHGHQVSFVPVDENGTVDLAEIEKAITPDTAVVSIVLVNNEVGTIQPVPEIAAVARRHGILFHVDAVQALGKIPVNVAQLGADMLSLSAHKVHGPKGVGALFVRRGAAIEPLLHGGHQEHGLRAGTENVVGIIGFAEAVQLLRSTAVPDPTIRARRDRLEESLQAKFPRMIVNGKGAPRSPAISNVTFPDLDAAYLARRLDRAGIMVSVGSACNSGSGDPSHVLRAMGRTTDLAQGVRFSLSRMNTDEEIDIAIETVEKIGNFAEV